MAIWDVFFSLYFKYLLINVVHHFIIAAGCINTRNNSGCQTIHQFAQNDAIAQCIFICNWWETLADHRFDPLLSLVLLIWFTFTSNLAKNNKETIFISDTFSSKLLIFLVGFFSVIIVRLLDKLCHFCLLDTVRSRYILQYSDAVCR